MKGGMRRGRPGHLGLSSSAELLVRLLQALQVATNHCVFVVIPCDAHFNLILIPADPSFEMFD